MKNNKTSIAVIFAVALMFLITLPCAAQAAGIATDYQSYAQGDVLKIAGFGWQPNESVSLVLYDSTDLNNSYYTFVAPVQADSNGNFIDTEYIIQAADEGRTFLLAATGQTSGQAQTVFDDAAHLHIFEDAAQNIPRDAFAYGTTVYTRADDLNSRPCWQIRWINPSSGVVAIHNLDASNANSRNDSFVVPASGPSGVWRAELYSPSTAGTCASGPSFTLRYTYYFDVAQIVVIGADDSYITSQAPNFNSNSSLLRRYFLDVNGDLNNTEKTFLRFTLPSFSGSVLSAKVRMRLLVPPSNSRTYDIRHVIDPWNVNSINWNNRPTVAGISNSQTIPTGFSAINSLVRWDVTSDIRGFANGSFANNGWQILDSVSVDPEGIFYSTEVNNLLGNKLNGPVLLFDTDPAVPVPTVTEWGMIIFLLLAGLGSVYFLNKQKKAQS